MIADYLSIVSIITNTRWVALMIQLEQQQHGEFVGGWWGGVGGLLTVFEDDRDAEYCKKSRIAAEMYGRFSSSKYFRGKFFHPKLKIIKFQTIPYRLKTTLHRMFGF